jgi:hypothetical protein
MMTDKENAIEFAKWVTSEGFRMIGHKWQLREERLFDNELYQLYEEQVKSALAPVSLDEQSEATVCDAYTPSLLNHGYCTCGKHEYAH